MSELYNSLKDYSKEGVYPLHMPGHKRNVEVNKDDPLAAALLLDITEINNFDNLHAAEGIIKRLEEKYALAYKSENTHLLVNGTTSGILSGISAMAELFGNNECAKVERGTLIIGRNCHKSVYNAAILNNLKLAYIYPEFDNDFDINTIINPRDIENIINDAENKGETIVGLVITSPTYDGVVSDIENIANIAHMHNIPLMVDEAHGAHLGFIDNFPNNSVNFGDIVVHSIHKTLPAPTQTAIIHINGELILDEVVKKYLHIYQTSSPSYILMAGADRCLDIVNLEGNKRLQDLLKYRQQIEEASEHFNYIRIYKNNEPGKLVISVKGTEVDGLWLSEILRNDYKIEVEMVADSYVLGILTMMDTEEGILRIIDALSTIDRKLSKKEDNNSLSAIGQYTKPLIKYELYQAFHMKKKEITYKDAKGMCAGEFINLYPPGYPIVAPGEIIDDVIITRIENYLNRNYEVQGIQEGKIKVLWEN